MDSSDITTKALPEIVVKPESQTAANDPQQQTHAEAKYLNREISWLRFNMRVLAEAKNALNPLLERVRFLSISASNLEEFFMIRVAGLNEQLLRGTGKLSEDGLSASDQLGPILKTARQMVDDQQACWRDLKRILAEQAIKIVHATEITAAEKKWIESYFVANIFPTITPIAVDPAHPFPFLPNKSLTAIYSLEDILTRSSMTALMLLPAKMPRFIRLAGNNSRYVTLEDVLDMFVPVLFPGHKPVECGFFQILRDSELAISDDAEDIVSHYEKAVKVRKRGSAIGLILNKEMPSALRKFLTSRLAIANRYVFQTEGLIGLSDVKELCDLDRPDLKFTPFVPRYPERLSDHNDDCFAAIQAKDLVLHHPYETFDVVLRFLRQAAADENVISIKQTLYRTNANSPVVKALIEAAESGKAVTAVIELRARFDEETNLKLARDLERVGVQVIYGIVNLKTHAKVTLVTRKEQDGLRSYVHFGTGNYNPVTARLYTDLSFFTCDQDLCQDAARMFNYLTGYATPEKFHNLVMAPLFMRGRLLDLIETEAKNAEAGKPAAIWAKMNSLVDAEITDALYRASQKGVKIDLVVRGICCLRPGVKGLSENIRVKSIVGRFLEHSRIFCFAQGHTLPHGGAKVYISSGDWMTRNLDHRVEFMIEVRNPTVHEQIMNQIMAANLLDESLSWSLLPNGDYERVKPSGKILSAQEFFMKIPSVSGRGSAQHNPRQAESKKSKKYNPNAARSTRKAQTDKDKTG